MNLDEACEVLTIKFKNDNGLPEYGFPNQDQVIRGLFKRRLIDYMPLKLKLQCVYDKIAPKLKDIEHHLKDPYKGQRFLSMREKDLIIAKMHSP